MPGIFGSRIFSLQGIVFYRKSSLIYIFFSLIFLINKYILFMKTASETFTEHLTAVVRTGVTEALATLGDDQLQRSIQPEGGCTAGFCPKSHVSPDMPRLVSHLQGSSSDYKTKPSLCVCSICSYCFDEPFSASMARRGGLSHPWHLGELTVFQCCRMSGTPLRPQHHCNPKCLIPVSSLTRLPHRWRAKKLGYKISSTFAQEATG